MPVYLKYTIYGTYNQKLGRCLGWYRDFLSFVLSPLIEDGKNTSEKLCIQIIIHCKILGTVFRRLKANTKISTYYHWLNNATTLLDNVIHYKINI
jgi:hypothetical protein